MNRSASMPGRWLPWPGNRKATCPVGSPSATKTPSALRKSRAAEAEAADPGDPRGGRRRPGPGGLVEGEGAGVGLPGAGRALEVQCARAYAGVHGERGLDDPGEARGALGVADLRLHRAECDRA